MHRGLGPRASAAIALAVVVAGCGPAVADPADAVAARALHLTTTGCGHASDRTGSAVAIGDGMAVTAAHVVVQADEVAVTLPGVEDAVAAEVVAVDRRLDLALLSVPTDLQAIRYGAGKVADSGEVVGSAVSGTVAYRIVQVANISIEEVLGTQRHERLGYQLDASTQAGDSGAGAFNAAGELVGIVFATSSDPSATWITASSTVESFVAANRFALPLQCDPELSRLAESTS